MALNACSVSTHPQLIPPEAAEVSLGFGTDLLSLGTGQSYTAWERDRATRPGNGTELHGLGTGQSYTAWEQDRATQPGNRLAVA